MSHDNNPAVAGHEQLPGTGGPWYRSRWTQLVLGIIAMVSISSPQYTWALFTEDLEAKLGVGLAALQVTFSLLIVLQTWLAPVQGYLVDRFGPRLLISLGAVLTGLSWVLASMVESTIGLYLTYGVVGGIGTGIVYIGVIGIAVRWFPDRRGLVAGLAASGYGAGAFLTTIPIANMLDSVGFEQTLLVFGIIQGVVGGVAALGLRRPPISQSDVVATGPSGAVQSRRNYSPREMLRTPPFWVMFLMMSLMSTSGLMVTSQVGAFAADFGVADVTVLGIAALSASLLLSRVTNGLSRPFFGWVSDHIGREQTMVIAFGLEALGVFALVFFADNPVAFVLLTGIVFFGWGEIFSLFPTTLTDIYGPRHATTNYGFLYTAQGIGALLGGPAAALLFAVAGGWTPVFILIAAADAFVVVLAWFVLRPIHHRWVERETIETESGMRTELDVPVPKRA